MRASVSDLERKLSSLVSPSNTAPDLTDPAKHVAGYFRTADNDLVQGAVAADFVFNDLGLTSFATGTTVAYAVGLATAFADAYKALGGRDCLREGGQRGRYRYAPRAYHHRGRSA